MWAFFLRLLASIVLTGISAYLSYRKPEAPTPGTLDDLGNPRAEEGTEIPKIFGTVNIADPQVVQYGDFATSPIIEKGGRKYGFVGPKQKITIGFQYYIGLHFVLCLGVVDYLSRIRIDKRNIAIDAIGAGSVSVNLPNLFGSSKREGGVGGTIDFMTGSEAQPVNGYLAGITSGPVSANRGVASLVARRFYIGNSPSLRPWDVRLTRIYSVDPGYNDGSQWYPEKAEIAKPGTPALPEVSFDLAATFAEYDVGIGGNPGVGELHPGVLTIGPFIDRRIVIAGPSGARADDRFLLNGVLFPGSNNQSFASGTLFYTLPAGEALTVRVQDVAADICGGYGSLIARAVGSEQPDMNPAHILREILLSPDCGGTGISADADDTWEAAADTLYTETFGLSIAWRGATDRAQFKQEIERHIDARTYVNRRTGKWSIKLIRDDYDEETLPVFDASNVSSWSAISFPQLDTLLNQLVVTWTDYVKDEESSLTISNPARIRMNGSQVFQEKAAYPGIQRSDLAGRVAARDLSARSAPLVTGEFVTKNLPSDLNLGDPIVVNNPRLGLNNKVVRITEIEDGNIKDSSARVKFIEDKFAIKDESPLEVEVIEPVVNVPEPMTPRQVEEAPYQLLVERLGLANATLASEIDVDSGFLFVAAGEPNPLTQEALLLRDAGAGYEELLALVASPAAVTISPMSRIATETKVVVESRDDIASVALGSIAWLDGEQVAVDLIEEGDTSGTGDYWEPTATPTDGFSLFTLTLRRGCMDTVPALHTAGASLVIYAGTGELEDDFQTAADVLNVKLQTVMPSGVLALDDAPVDTVTFASRAARPYAPGRFKLNGSYQNQFIDSADLTWVDRDRLADDIADPVGHDDLGVTSEAGVTYLVRAEAYDSDGVFLETFIEEDVGAALTYSWDGVTPALPVDAAIVKFSVASVRGGYESWQKPSIDMFVFFAPGDLTAEVL